MAWEAAGYLAALGIRKVAANAKFRQAMDPASAVAPAVLLDIDRVITDGHFFQFGVPWGWRDLFPEEHAHVVANTGLPVVAGVAAERADNDLAGMIVSPFHLGGESLSSIFMQADEFHKERFSKLPNGHPLGSPTKILIDGELGLLFHLAGDVAGAVRGQPSEPVVPVSGTECYFARRGQAFRVDFSASPRYHERYLPCLWTMFGSWRWMR
jgi:hypothetical protein